MAKVFIEETTLTKIGNAIRGKTGKTELIDPAVMDVEITNIPSGGGSDDIPSIELTGNCGYACAGALAGAFLDAFPNKVTTTNISAASSMFEKCTAKRIPFDLNFKPNSSVTMADMFSKCNNLTHINDITVNTGGTNYYTSLSYTFNQCTSLVNPPRLINIRPSTLGDTFNGCYRLQMPDDYFDTFDTSYATTTGVQCARTFSSCYSMRRVPSSFFTFASKSVSGATYSMYTGTFNNCFSLDEMVNVPVLPLTFTSNAFASFVSGCGRLSKLTFETNEDGTPKTANWKSQTIDLTSSVGYLNAQYVNYLNQYTNITTATRVTSAEQYQALKNDPDWWTTEYNYSRFNHDSAVETINSLPDTSAYLATAGGTNTIKLKKLGGTSTDGGAIQNLTEAEIAIAAAKGWTVTLS